MSMLVCNMAHLMLCDEEHCDHKEPHEAMFGWDACFKTCGRNQDARCINPLL